MKPPAVISSDDRQRWHWGELLTLAVIVAVAGAMVASWAPLVRNPIQYKKGRSLGVLCGTSLMTGEQSAEQVLEELRKWIPVFDRPQDKAEWERGFREGFAAGRKDRPIGLAILNGKQDGVEWRQAGHPEPSDAELDAMAPKYHVADDVRADWKMAFRVGWSEAGAK